MGSGLCFHLHMIHLTSYIYKYKDPFHKGFTSSYLKSCMNVFALIFILMIQSGHKFTHVMTIQMSLHVQNNDLIWSLFSIWAQGLFLTTFCLWAHKLFVKWFQAYHGKHQVSLAYLSISCTIYNISSWPGFQTILVTMGSLSHINYSHFQSKG